MKALRVLLALLLLAAAGAASVRGAEPGTSGWASHYGPGNGVAMHFCTWTLRHASGCGWVRIQSAETGLVVEAPVIDYCFCHVEPSSYPDRLVDLQYGVVAALGLDTAAGLYPVTIWLIPDGPAFLPDQDVGIPDTAAADRGSLTVLFLALAALALLLELVTRRHVRCAACGHRIWPWQRIGFITGKTTWHVRCVPSRGSTVEEVLLWLYPDFEEPQP